MLHMLYVCWSTCENKSKGVKHNEMVCFEYNFCIYNRVNMWVTSLNRDKKELSNGI